MAVMPTSFTYKNKIRYKYLTGNDCYFIFIIFIYSIVFVLNKLLDKFFHKFSHLIANFAF